MNNKPPPGCLSVCLESPVIVNNRWIKFSHKTERRLLTLCYHTCFTIPWCYFFQLTDFNNFVIISELLRVYIVLYDLTRATDLINIIWWSLQKGCAELQALIEVIKQRHQTLDSQNSTPIRSTEIYGLLKDLVVLCSLPLMKTNITLQHLNTVWYTNQSLLSPLLARASACWWGSVHSYKSNNFVAYFQEKIQWLFSLQITWSSCPLEYALSTPYFLHLFSPHRNYILELLGTCLASFGWPVLTNT